MHERNKEKEAVDVNINYLIPKLFLLIEQKADFCKAHKINEFSLYYCRCATFL